MPTLRLFANLREAAGASTVHARGSTVEEIITEASNRYGSEFASGVVTARVWVNGEPAELDTAVGSDDEVALIPPVSGGEVVAEPSTQAFQAVLVIALVGAVFIANYVSLETFVFVVVGTGLAWLWDLRDTTDALGRHVNVVPSLFAVAVSANGAYRWGYGGFAGSLAVVVVITLVWSLYDQQERTVERVAATSLLGLYAGLGSGAMVMIRMRTIEEVTTFLAIVAVAGAAAWVAHRYASSVVFLDANLAVLAGALVAGLVAGLVVGRLSVQVTLLASAGVAAGMIAGRALGSLMRTGTIVHTTRPPGLLALFDGPILAAAVFWFTVVAFS